MPSKKFFCIDAHTCGNPVRLVAGGGPVLEGEERRKISTIIQEAIASRPSIPDFTKENKIIVEVGVDLDYFFDGQTPLRIREIPSCTAPGDLARKISENFIGTFTGLTISSSL